MSLGWLFLGSSVGMVIGSSSLGLIGDSLSVGFSLGIFAGILVEYFRRDGRIGYFRNFGFDR